MTEYTLEERIRSIAKYLGANEGEMVSEVTKLLKQELTAFADLAIKEMTWEFENGGEDQYDTDAQERDIGRRGVIDVFEALKHRYGLEPKK